MPSITKDQTCGPERDLLVSCIFVFSHDLPPEQFTLQNDCHLEFFDWLSAFQRSDRQRDEWPYSTAPHPSDLPLQPLYTFVVHQQFQSPIAVNATKRLMSGKAASWRWPRCRQRVSSPPGVPDVPHNYSVADKHLLRDQRVAGGSLMALHRRHKTRFKHISRLFAKAFLLGRSTLLACGTVMLTEDDIKTCSASRTNAAITLALLSLPLLLL